MWLYIQGDRIGTIERLDIKRLVTSSQELNNAHFAWTSGYMDGWRQSKKKK